MKIQRQYDPRTKSAAILGAFALLLNAVSYFLLPDLKIPLGNVFIFWSALSLGFYGAAVTVAVGVLPELILTFDWIYALRAGLLATYLAYAAQRFPKLPPYVVSFVFWITLFGPAHQTLSALGYAGVNSSMTYIIGACTSDVTLAIVAGLLLLNQSVWALTTNRPRHVDLGIMLNHLFALFAMFVLLFGGLVAYGLGVFYGNASPWVDPRIVFGTIALVSISASTCGWMLARLLSTNINDYLAPALLAETKAKGFSGRYADFWRRRTTTDLIPENMRSDTPSDSDRRLPTKLREQVLSSGSGICALNRNGTIIFVNRRFRKLVGIQQNEVIGKKIDALGVKSEVIKSLFELIQATFDKGPRTAEIKLTEENGKLRFLEASTQQPDAYKTAVLGDGPDSAIITLRDITDRRTVEKHLLEGQRLASLGRIVRGLAHSFNNSLTTITARASFARYDKKSEDLDRTLDEILSAANKAGSLVRTLIDFADGKPSLLEKGDLASMIADRLELLEKLGGEKHPVLFSRPSGKIGIQSDPNQILQALSNLVINSVEAYGDNRGEVQILLDTETIEEEAAGLHIGARPGRFARLRIRDQGVGMSAEIMHRAFDPLFTTKAGSGHTGLGLSVVHAVVRGHDGFLTIESHPDKGTTVTLYLPLVELLEVQAKAPPKIKAAENGAPSENGAARKDPARILVVEDEDHVRELIAELLSSLGYQVTSCANGVEALDRFRASEYDLVVVDMIMPRMDGYELINLIKKDNATIKTLAMSGYGLDEEKVKAFSNVIPKPFDFKSFVSAVQNTLG